ncbi:kinesin [Salinibacter altiplanensis]|uniref:kinesin n=1 Tax=Salinibacter altiplanensis TaxID=1803181 RepID=UPI000C9FC51D|nr:kinesin [Salinibacter altiplanensis]
MQSTVIKYTLLIAGAALGTFAVALLGAYLLMPSIAPEMAGGDADSLATSGRDTTQQASMPGDTTAASPQDTTAASPLDTTAMRSPRDSTGGRPRDSARGGGSVVQRLRDSLEVVGQLQDSVRALREELRTTEQEATTLQERVASLENREAKVDELKDALLGMGQRELATVLTNVDMKVLKTLYQRTSGRTRTQLLQAISAERTAQFVNQVVEEEDAAADTTAGEGAGRKRGRDASPFR